MRITIMGARLTKTFMMKKPSGLLAYIKNILALQVLTRELDVLCVDPDPAWTRGSR